MAVRGRPSMWCLLALVGCVQPPPVVTPVCAVQQRLELGDARVGAETSLTLTVSNPFDVPGQITVSAPPAPFSVEQVGALRLAAHESRAVRVIFSPESVGDVERPWSFTPSVGCEATEITLAGFAFDAAVSVSPGRLDFGSLSSGVGARAATLRNHTRADVEITSLSFTNAAFSSATSLPLTIPALGSAELNVEARGSGVLEGLLTIATGVLELELPLLANRTAACLRASRATIEFSSVEQGCRGGDEQVTVTNTCAHQVKLIGSEASPGFAIVAGPPNSFLRPGESMHFALSPLPQRAGALAGRLTVSADVLDGPQAIEVPLVGSATPMLMREEEYLNPRRLVDVLIVLDDSAAMVPFADAVRRNLKDFAEQSIGNGEDLRVGVMTTSTAPAELGQLRRTASGASWLEDPSVAEVEALAAVTGTSTAPSSCLEVLHSAFLTRAQIGPMLRPHAFLRVFCITSGVDAVQTAPLPLVNSLRSLLPNSQLTVVAHFDEVPGCAATLDTGALSILLERNLGFRQEICEPSWWLGEGINHFGPRTNFFLNERPAFTRAPLEVAIDGVVIPQGHPRWEYDSGSNSVNFEPLTAPRVGQTLQFRYAPDCQ